jgi:transposase InsO family protein
LLKLGCPVSATAIRSVLRQHRVPPVPRQRGLAWRAFLGAQARAILACDFFRVETLRLQTLYVLFFLEVGTRRVFLAGCTERPSADWVTLQARNLVWDLEDGGVEATLLIRDRDSKFTPAFDAVFSSHGVRVVRTPVRAPRANAYAERWVGTVRRECLDWVLILGQRHLEHVLREYVSHYNRARPHRALQLEPPLTSGPPGAPVGPVRRRDLLGGLIHEYSRQVA